MIACFDTDLPISMMPMNLDVIINPHHLISSDSIIITFPHQSSQDPRENYRFGSNMMGNDDKGEDMKRKSISCAPFVPP